MTQRTCELCEKPHHARGWCWMHYSRWLRHGDPEAGLRPEGSLSDRMWPKIDKTESCWVWTAGVNTHGYARLREGGRGAKQVSIHRWMYEHKKGPIPDGFDIDHLCRNRRCVNPDHLDAVTRSENMIRANMTPEDHWALRPEGVV